MFIVFTIFKQVTTGICVAAFEVKPKTGVQN